MKITNATWDQDITGIKTCEIIFEKGDNIENYLKAGIENEFRYSIVKVPVGELKIVHCLEEFGYRYLENQLTLSFKTEQLERIDKKWMRLLNGFNYKLAENQNDINSIIKQVGNNMFNTDRYSLDPYWGDTISSKRYMNWINYLFRDKTVRVYIMVKRNKEVGFFTVKKEKNNIFSCPIAGIYNQFKFSGFIFVLVFYILEISRDMGADQFITSISSNNQNLLSSFSKIFNFKVNETSIVLRKVIY